ncbi:MAG: hypothetical protein Q9191_002090 [Dirinaria sp. TL-2023a]
MSEEHKDTYCNTCREDFGTAWELKQHNRARHPQFKCSQCSDIYNDEAALKAHWRSAIHEATYDDICEILFESATAKWSHQKDTPDKHHVCERCRLVFGIRDELIAHFTQHIAHIHTYCHACQQDFSSLTDLQAHTQAKHPVIKCVLCQITFANSDQLKEHMATSQAHMKDHRPLSNDSKGVGQQTRTLNEYPVSCFACACQDFEKMSAMLQHIEGEKCISGAGSQHINSLATQCPTADTYILKEHEPWLRAGAPPSVVRSAYIVPSRNTWRCPVCKQIFLSEADITRHYENQSCTNDYPYTLKCPECSKLFTHLSALYDHCESTACGEKALYGPLAKLNDYLRNELQKPAQIHTLSQVKYGLSFDTSRKPARVIVAVVRKTLRSNSGVTVNSVGV